MSSRVRCPAQRPIPLFTMWELPQFGGSSNHFSGNTVTVSPAQYTTNGSGYYGIAVNAMFLDANFDNFTNNFFTNGGLGVLAEGYPITGSVAPNTDTTNAIDT